MFTKLVREPLLHFVLLGAGLFLASSLINKGNVGDNRTIIVGRDQVEQVVDTFTRTSQRPPTDQEKEGLIRDYIRGEVYYREALAMGLDRNDAVIRPRLRTKLQFMVENIAAQVEPTDEQLRTYLTDHADKFRVDERFTFNQVYLDPDLHGKNIIHDAQKLVERLSGAQRAQDAPDLGDQLLMEPRTDDVSYADIVKDFGDKFAAALQKLPIGKWQGPIESGFGEHLIFLSKRTEGRIPELDEVREVVRREWANDYRVETGEKFYESLLERYTVKFERPDAASGNRGAAQ
jgi:parvulin-like peptidyl-prolyl cis-trans isomerase-like protein